MIYSLNIRRINELSGIERKAITNFLVSCFIDNKLYVNSVYTNKDLEMCLLMYQGKELVGHVGITKRKVGYEGNTYLVAGIGDVAVKEKLRHEGLGLKLMKKVNETIKSEGYDIGVLFCHPKLDDFYTRAGWIKKNDGKIFAWRKGVLEDQRLTYLLRLNIEEDDMRIWENEDIVIGEGSW